METLRHALEELAAEAARSVNFQDCSISLYDTTAGDLVTMASSNPSLDIPSTRFKIGEGVAGYVAQTLQPVLISDTSRDTHFLHLGRRSISSVLCVPIKRQDGALVGTITAVSSDTDAFTDYHLRILQMLGDLASLTVSEIIRAQQLRTLNYIGQQLLGTASIHEVFDLLVDTLRLLVPVDLLRLELETHIRRSDERILYIHTWPEDLPQCNESIKIPGQNEVQVLTRDDILSRNPSVADKLTCETYIYIPLQLTTGALGYMMLGSQRPYSYTQDHINTLQSLGMQVAIWLRNRNLLDLERVQAERLEAVFSSGSDAILMISDGRIERANPSACKLLGISEGEYGDDSIIAHLMPSPANLHIMGATSHIHTPTGMREVEVSSHSISTYGREHTILTLRDVTEQMELSRAKANFISMVSHELRTPLNSVLGFTDILLTGAAGPLTDHQKEFLGHVRSSSRHLVQLVNDILDLSRIDAGNFRLDIGPFLPGIIARKVVDDISGIARASGIHLVADIKPKLPTANGDGRRIEQVLINLVGNALKVTPAGGKVSVGVDCTSEEIVFNVRDTGPGIPESERERIFERFYQTVSSPNEATKGTGLGLAIASHLVEAHGGRLWLESGASQGSTFYFSIPIKPSSKHAAHVASSS